MSKKRYFVYILANKNRNVLYVGITDNLVKRVWQHKDNAVQGFTSKYNVQLLVYFEEYSDPLEAIKREKQIKKWSRIKKENLIKTLNPELEDLYITII